MTATDSVGTSVAELPVHLTQFVGRALELEELTPLVRSARLLTLTGAGGCGKSRLAHECALRSTGAFCRIAWADLAPLADGGLLAAHVAAALRVPDRPGVAPLEAIVAAVGDEPVLLVLDGCEHLVDACAALAEALLRACPFLTILATSREALGVASETAWLVPPLAGGEAAQLFVDRARATLPTFALTPGNTPAVQEICRRLDGLPLAIELAAARVRVLSPEQIARRLDDAFRLLTGGSRTALPRHRTLRATMEWSHALLSAREQVLLRRLAVFAGSFALDAAEAVCAGGPLEADDILDGISALVDKSLVAMESDDGEARYRLLEAVRQYGVERLAEAGEREAIEARHGEHFLAVAEGAAPRLFGGEAEPGIIARLLADDENLRRAAAWALTHPARAAEALRFADALFWYWYGSSAWLGRGHFREARPYVTEALARGAACHPLLRARALSSRGLVGLVTGDYADAGAALDEALALARAHGEASLVAFVLAKSGAARLMAGDLDGASAMLAEASALVEPMPRSMLHAFVWFWHGWTDLARGDPAAARARAEAHERLGAALGHRTIRGHSQSVFGRVELAEGRVDAAFARFSAALQLHLDLGDGWGLMLDLEGLAAVAVARHRHADAARLLGASDVLRERTTLAIPATERAEREARLTQLRERLGADQLARLLAEGGTLAMEDVVRLATDDAVGHTTELPAVLAAPPRVEVDGERARLRVLALGPLQVFVGGRAVEPAAWGSARPRELLAYLLLHPEGRTKEQVGLAFWPDASPAQLRNSFHVTLHRLRRALGDPGWVTLVADRYRMDPALVEEFDVHAFEREVAAARRALQRQQEGATALLEQAVARFRGDFLDGEPAGDWHLEHRERLQRLYVDALMALGARLAEEERHARAADAYRRVLARDELHEEALVALMRCHVALGERAQALRAYQRFADRLRDELGARPGAAATRLVERLQQGTGV